MAMVAPAKFLERNEQILRLYDQGLSYNQIADRLGINRNMVAGTIHRAGRKSRGGKKKPYQSLVGRRFGRLDVLKRGKATAQGATTYDCLCDCGTSINVQRSNLTAGRTKSCGCLAKEWLSPGPHRERPNPDTKEILQLSNWGWTVAEIAQALDYHTSTIYKILSRVRQAA